MGANKVGSGKETKIKCNRAGRCAAQLLWTKLSRQMARILDGVSFEELANWEKELKE
ncbi:MAG: hypothetical protein QME81_13955 [bacterium]|nr:hypothetical protein [bacterium]